MPEFNNAWTYVLAHEDVVLTREFVHQLAKKMKGLNLSRQKSANWLDQRLFHDLDAPVHLPGGEPRVIHLNIIEEAFGGTDEYRWLTDVKRFASDYPERAPNKRNLLRLQLLDLAFKVADNPTILP